MVLQKSFPNSCTTKGDSSCEKHKHIIGDMPESVLPLEYSPRLSVRLLLLKKETSIL